MATGLSALITQGMKTGWRPFKPIPYLEFSAGIELAQALHSLLAMHHGRHSGPLLKRAKKDEEKISHQQFRGIWTN